MLCMVYYEETAILYDLIQEHHLVDHMGSNTEAELKEVNINKTLFNKDQLLMLHEYQVNNLKLIVSEYLFQIPSTVYCSREYEINTSVNHNKQ